MEEEDQQKEEEQQGKEEVKKEEKGKRKRRWRKKRKMIRKLIGPFTLKSHPLHSKMNHLLKFCTLLRTQTLSFSCFEHKLKYLCDFY